MIQCFTHCLQASLVTEVIPVTKQSFLCRAEVGCLGSSWHASIALVVNSLSILHVELNNVLQHSVWSMELGHHSEFLRCVHCIRTSRTVEICVAHAVWIDIATISVCGCNVPISILRSTFRITIANEQTFFCTWMGSVSCGHSVCFPLHKLHISGTLPITVSSAIRRTRFVCTSSIAMTVHLHKIHGCIEATGHVRQVNVERHFLVQHSEHFVLGFRLKHVQPGPNIFGIRKCLSTLTC